jgi:uncharacterized membrane protein YccC
MIDASTDTWRAVVAECNNQIEAARTRLEANDQHYGESQFLRGRIAALREILAMARPALVTAAPPERMRGNDPSGY